MNAIITQYINNVKRELYQPVNAEAFILDLQANLEEFVLQFPDSSYSDLVEQFGPPATVAEEYLNSQGLNDSKGRIKHKNKTRVFFIVCIALIIFLTGMVIALSGNRQAYYTDTTTIETEIEVSTE